MIYIIELILFMLCYLSYLKTKKIYNPGTLFIGFWLIIISLYNFHYYGLLTASNKMLELICFGCIFFWIGTLLPVIKTKKSENIDINNNIFFIFFIILDIAVLLFRFYLQIPYFKMGYSITEIRYSGIISYGMLEAVLFNYFALPFTDAAIIILLTKNIYNEVKLKNYLLPFFLMLISMASNGARLAIYQGIIIIVSSFVILKKKVNFSKINVNKIYRIIILISICILCILYINGNRNSSKNIFEGIYDYFCGSIVFSSSVLENKIDLQEYLYGVNSFGGILRPIYTILGVFGIQESDALYKAGIFMSNSMQNYIVPINYDGGIMNYFCTCFIYMYKDGGFLAVAIISALYGMIVNKFYRNLENKKNMINLIFYNWIICGIGTSMMHFCFSYFIYVMEFVYIWLIIWILKKVIKRSEK